MNVKLLRKIQKHILAEPKRFIMGDTSIRSTPGMIIEDFGLEWPLPRCGTAACICGWACILGGKSGVNDEFRVASGLLGIANYESLFFVSGWPRKYLQQWNAATTPAGRARAASRRIDHYIKTKGAE